ncbi:MAG: DsrE family protein [Acidiferrobacterales bacterium]
MKSLIFSTIISLSTLLSLSFMAAPAFSQEGEPRAKIENRTDGRYVIDVTLHTAEEIEALLTRAEELYESGNNKNNGVKYTRVGIALVLHGDEIKLFDKKYYKKYKKIVDKAAKLDANNVIEIKICNTKMRELGLEKKDMPPFAEIVPYGPDEVDDLVKKGYLYL